MLLPDAQRALAARFGLAEGQDSGEVPSPEKTGVWEPERFTVAELPPNWRVLVARAADGRRVRVRVRDNRLFVRGQAIEARRTEPASPDIYELTSRHPRRRGDRA